MTVRGYGAESGASKFSRTFTGPLVTMGVGIVFASLAGEERMRWATLAALMVALVLAVWFGWRNRHFHGGSAWQPTLLASVGVLAFAALWARYDEPPFGRLSWLDPPEWIDLPELSGQWWGPTVTRAAVALILAGLLWAIAKGFSLTSLRVSTVALVFVAALMVTWIGRDSIEEAELADYEATKLELDVEVLQGRAEAATPPMGPGPGVVAEILSDAVAGVQRVFGPAPPACNGVPLGAGSGLVGYDRIARCADAISAGCAENAPPGAPCEPRTALRLLYLGFLQELTSTPRPADADAATALDVRIAEIQQRLQELGEPVPLTDLITNGADDLLTEALKPVTNNDIPTGLAGLGWIVLALLVIVLYRSLEAANDRRRPGPALVSATNDGSKHAAELFRVILGRVDLAEPAPVPGGQVAASAGDAFQGEHISNKAVQFVAAVFQSTAFPKQGVEIQVTCREIPRPAGDRTDADSASTAGDGSGDEAEPAGDDPKSTEILVRGLERRTGRLMFADDFVDDIPIRAISKAAYFSAARVLETGYTTPNWLRWRTLGYEGLRSYHRATFNRDFSDADRRARFEDAVARNPSTGAALVAHSNELALEGELLDSARFALFARQRDKRFWTARYRLGTTLSMIAGDMERFWNSDPERTDLTKLLSSYDADFADDSTAELRLLQLARRELKAAERLLSRWRVIGNARRQREREYWLRLLRSPDRRALVAAAQTALLLVDVRIERCRSDDRSVADGGSGHLAELDHILRVMRNDDATTLYNAACLHAEIGELETAADLLKQSRFARSGASITVEWLEQDPDLGVLRASSWWPEVCETIDRVKRLGSEPGGSDAKVDHGH